MGLYSYSKVRNGRFFWKKIIVIEVSLNRITNKIKIFEILFENIGIDAINFEPQKKCSWFAGGIGTGIVLDSGDGVTHCIPANYGDILKHSFERIDIAGWHITEYLAKILQKKGYIFI